MEAIPGCSGVVKRPKCSAMSVNEKTIVLNVYNSLRTDESYLKVSVDNVITKCSNMTGVSKTTIYKILRENKRTGTLAAPMKHKGRKEIELDEFETNGIRRHVHSFFFKNELPTLNKVLAAIHQDPDLPNITKWTLWKTLRKINFRFLKRNRESFLTDKVEIIVWRRKYLRSIKAARESGKHIFYLDETWLNEGHTVSKVWQDGDVRSRRQAFLEGWSTGLKNPSGKGRRLILTHIGSADGFLDDGLLLFESKTTRDYHEEMNANVFEEWFEKILGKVPENSVIVLDDASYHSRRLERLPTTSWRKGDIAAWLDSKNIPFERNLLKSELLSLAEQHKVKHMKYAVDEMALARGVTVLRLPPYHCELNPIELIWAQVKGYVARHNVTFKLKDVKASLVEAISAVDATLWKKCIEHTKEEERRMLELDNHIEVTVEPIVIDVNQNDSDSSTDLYTDSDSSS